MNNTIPKQLSNMRFNRVRFKDKRAFEKGWQNKPYTYEEIQNYFPKENYGVMCGKEIRVLDDDSEDKRLVKLFVQTFGQTFKVRDHLYFRFDNEHDKKIIFNDVEDGHLGELQGSGTYVVGAGSTHPSGEKYEQKNDLDIITISYDKFCDVFKEYIGSKLTQTKKVNVPGIGMVESEEEDEFIKNVKEKWVSGDRQELAMSVAGYLRKNKRLGLDSALSIVEGIARDCNDEEVSQRLAAVHATYGKDESEIKGISGLKDIGVGKNNDFAIFGIKGQVEQFYNNRPFCYNKSGMFLVWDNELKKYDIVDDTDMLNGMEDLGIDTISSKMKTEILNALKQYGRRNIPLDPLLSWVQFKDRVFDFKSGEEFEATPKYLFTNPMPYSPGVTEETPIIDSLFEEWVGKDYKKTLEEIAAYSTCADQFMQRLIALHGGGSNGKGTYNKFLIRLLGEDNTCSSEIKELSSNQFETSVIWKKQLCIMGEMSQGDMKNTNQLKKLSGEDKIRYCFKGKTPFTDTSITTLISNTNNLPKTPDKTMGFYRKWLIVDFPNQFTKIKHGLIENISDEEMENFCRKILRILKELYKTQKFTNEGSFQDRMDRYEERSNPIPKFIENHFEELIGSSVELKYFCNLFNKFAKENHQSILSVRQIGKMLREDGYETTARKRDMGDGTKSSSVVIMNLSLKTIETIETIVNLSESPCKESNEKHDGSNGSNGFDIIQKQTTLKTIGAGIKNTTNPTTEEITICPKCETPMIDNKCLGTDCE